MHENIVAQVIYLHGVCHFCYNSIKIYFWIPCHFYREQLMIRARLSFLRLSSQHSIDWLWTLDMSIVFSCSLKLIFSISMIYIATLGLHKNVKAIHMINALKLFFNIFSPNEVIVLAFKWINLLVEAGWNFTYFSQLDLRNFDRFLEKWMGSSYNTVNMSWAS